VFRNYLIAALRNLARNRLYASVNIIGLAVGLAGALCVFLFVRDELSFDRFLPGYRHIYLLSERMEFAGQAPVITPTTQSELAGWMKDDFPAVQAIARLMPSERSLRRGQVEANERIYWADSNFLTVLPLKVIAGDPRLALTQPDSIVLTRRRARKYFGEDAPLGKVIEINRQHAMQVTAILEDLPSTTHLDTEIIASGRAPFSELAKFDAEGGSKGSDAVYTYLRLAAGSDVQGLQNALPSFLERHKPAFAPPNVGLSLSLVPIHAVHLTHVTQKAMKPGGNPATIRAVGAVGVLIILVAIINFVNLSTARASRRAIEVGIRKAAGATREHLIVQFIGESVLAATVSMLGAVAMVELLLPQLNAFLGREIAFEYISDPLLLTGIVALTLLVGILAGVYPALVLAAFSPVAVLKGSILAVGGSGRVRQILVVLQFAVLMALILATSVIYRQAVFAMNDGMRLEKDAVLLISTSCQGAFQDEVAKLPGVRATACSGANALDFESGTHSFLFPDGTSKWITASAVDFGFFELYGLQARAGRLFQRNHAGDVLPPDFLEGNASGHTARVVLNETAVRVIGFPSPQAAIGQTMRWWGKMPTEIIGVVQDYSVDAVHAEIRPALYGLAPHYSRVLSVKLSGRDLPETLRAIDDLWRQTGEPEPITRFFLDEHLQTLYRDVTRQGTMFAVFASIAVIIACLGLFGLSVFTAERRTREIGIRKAMGASRGDVLRLLLWQFTRPVLWANLIAWPAGYLVMRRWLEGFAYHVDLNLASFLAASAAALLIAWITVLSHAVRVVRARPVAALRYE
jgi:putative ABC transport system permease protein